MKIQPARQALMVHTRDISRVIGMGGAGGGTEHDLDARHSALLNVIHLIPGFVFVILKTSLPLSTVTQPSWHTPRQLSLLPCVSRCRLS